MSWGAEGKYCALAGCRVERIVTRDRRVPSRAVEKVGKAINDSLGVFLARKTGEGTLWMSVGNRGCAL